MSTSQTATRASRTGLATDRRSLVKLAAVAGAAGLGSASGPSAGHAQGRHAERAGPGATGAGGGPGPLRKGMFGFTLAHEQFPASELVQLGALASRSGFELLATSDHLQPWQTNQGHVGQAWVTMGALGAQAPRAWMGTAVTCPTLRYNPAVVAEAFATLNTLYPGRVFLGVGSGEALNEQAATGTWPKWQERWDRLIEAITVIRALWGGQPVAHKGTYYDVNAKLDDAPGRPIPLITAANGKKSMRLAGQHGDGLISDPKSWKKWKSEWEAGARAAGKDPSAMPVIIEHYVVVGDKSEAEKAAELWRFGPKSWKGLFDVRDPAEIQRRAEAETPLSEVIEGWPIGTDPAPHIKAAHELFDSGVSVVNVHSGQADQKRVIEFYAQHVLPRVRQTG